MKLEQRVIGEWCVVRPDLDRLDAYVADEFKAALTQCAGEGVTKLVLDLETVEFMDSSGLGAIVYVLQRLGSGGKIAIAGATETVALMLRLTHMDRVLLTIDSPEQVLEATV